MMNALKTTNPAIILHGIAYSIGLVFVLAMCL